MHKTIVLAGGGTAGHISPALALNDRLEQMGHDVYFAGKPGGLEAKMCETVGIRFKGFESSGFDRSHPTTLIKGMKKISKSTKEAKKWFEEIKPDLVYGFGGYASIPATRAAEQMDIPVLLHETGGVMGLANKNMAKKACAITVANPEAKKGMPQEILDKIVVTGNPIRLAVFTTTREEGRKYLGIPDDATVITITGGSLGATHLNEAVIPMKEDFLSRPNVHVVHITGAKDIDMAEEALALTEEERERYHLFGFQDHMAEVLAASDAIVSRAGASAMAELSARAIPAILVPYPFASENHQMTNAQPYAECGGAFIVEDADIDGPEFLEKVFKLVDDGELREQMVEAAKTLDAPVATDKMLELVFTYAK